MSVDVVNNNEEVRNIVEAALYAADNPLSIDQILALFPEDERPEKSVIKDLLQSMEEEYENRGIELKHVSSGYRFQVKQQYSPWVSRLWEEKPPRYTKALLETLALIAYRQPITRADIEDVRGVAVSSNIIKTLQERNWIKVVGHRDVPGRPALFATTKEFLDYFNLKSMDELPTLAEIKSLDDIKAGAKGELESEFSEEELREVEEHAAAVEAEADTQIDADLGLDEDDFDDDDIESMEASDEDDDDDIEAIEASDEDDNDVETMEASDEDDDDIETMEASDEDDDDVETMEASDEGDDDIETMEASDEDDDDDIETIEASDEDSDTEVMDTSDNSKDNGISLSDDADSDLEVVNEAVTEGSLDTPFEENLDDNLDTVSRTAAVESEPEGTLLN